VRRAGALRCTDRGPRGAVKAALDEGRSRQLAAALGELTRQVLWARHAPRVLAAAPRTTLHTRVGAGHATNHRVDRAERAIITFGWRMVAAKAAGPDESARWLSGREILARGYFGGRLGLLDVLAHVVCHEFAHLVQTAEGARRRHSVHNAAFYLVLDTLHRDGSADAVRGALAPICARLGVRTDGPTTARADVVAQVLGDDPRHAAAGSGSRGAGRRGAGRGAAAERGLRRGQARGARSGRPAVRRCSTRFEPGDRVAFQVRGRRITGCVQRINRRSITVLPDVPDRPGQWWRVGPTLLLRLEARPRTTDTGLPGVLAMDRRDKKRIEVLQKKRSKLRIEISTVKRFPDDPAELPRLEQELAAIEAELEKLKLP